MQRRDEVVVALAILVVDRHPPLQKGGQAGGVERLFQTDVMSPQTFYEPSGRGFEAKVAERLAYWDEKRRERRETD